MKSKTRSNLRVVSMIAAIIILSVGLTACKGKVRHCYVIAKSCPSDVCLASVNPIEDGKIKVARGDEVLFANVYGCEVEVMLKYKAAPLHDFKLQEDGIEIWKVPKNLSKPGEDIVVRIKVCTTPAHGGPGMTVRP